MSGCILVVMPNAETGSTVEYFEFKLLQSLKELPNAGSVRWRVMVIKNPKKGTALIRAVSGAKRGKGTTYNSDDMVEEVRRVMRELNWTRVFAELEYSPSTSDLDAD